MKNVILYVKISMTPGNTPRSCLYDKKEKRMYDEYF